MARVRDEVIGRRPRVTGGVIEQPDAPQRVHPKPYPEPNPTRRTVTAPSVRSQPIPRAAYSIPELCEAFGISTRTYFNLRDEGRGPREMRLGRRVLITVESAIAWAREREEETAAANAA